VGNVAEHKSEQGSSLADEEELPVPSVEQEPWVLHDEQSTDWAISRPSPEQEPPKSLLLGIGAMT
jgi:hypothetical protein